MVSIIIDNSSLWNGAGGKVVLQPLSTVGVSMGASMWHYTFIAQLVGRHEGLFNPENSCLPRASSPEGDMNFLGWTNLRVSRLTGQLIVYYTESWRRTYYQGNMHWIEVLHALAFHSQWARLVAQNIYMCYDVIALAAAAQCRETWKGYTTSGGRRDNLSSLHVTALDQSYFFICHINFMHLFPSLEGDMICSTQKIYVARGWHEFSGLNNLHVFLLGNCNLKLFIIPKAEARRYTVQTWPCDMTSEGKHEDLSSLHVPSLNQSYFFIYRLNYMRYNNILCGHKSDQRSLMVRRLKMPLGILG